MYNVNMRAVEKGKYVAREKYFNEYAEEYFIDYGSENHDSFFQFVANEINNSIKRMETNIYGNTLTIQNKAMSYRIRLVRNQVEGNFVTYVLFNDYWEVLNQELLLGEYINQVYTIIEYALLRIDPFAWVRDLPIKTKLTTKPLARPEIWVAEAPSIFVRRSYAKEKKLYEGYLADYLKTIGGQFPTVNEYCNMHGCVTPAVNPLLTKSLEKDVELEEKAKLKAEENAARKAEEEAKKAEEAAKPKLTNKFCHKCGKPLPEGATFCSECGAQVYKPQEVVKQEETTIPYYQCLYISEIGDEADPYLYANVNPDIELVSEIYDHDFNCYRLNGLQIMRRHESVSTYTKVYENLANKDHYLFVSDSRVAFINKKYNKNTSGTWIGFGGLTAMVVSEAMNFAGKAIEKAKRIGKALTGHVRHEWISAVYFKEKQGFLDDGKVRILYKDLKKNIWAVTFYLPKDVSAEALANEILNKACTYRTRMTDKPSDDEMAFYVKYGPNKGRIPNTETNKTTMNGIALPRYYFATKGKPYRPVE